LIGDWLLIGDSGLVVEYVSALQAKRTRITSGAGGSQSAINIRQSTTNHQSKIHNHQFKLSD
jgi:hypothetical protein